ncbi:MAG: M23 family metallopeptidase [Sneathiellaceae bacterium]
MAPVAAAGRRAGWVQLAALLVAGLLAIAGPSAAQEPGRTGFLSFPADCTLGSTCYIQNYVDRDAGPGWQDVACHHLGYDGHKGTDIALVDEARIGDGVEVRAAADGVVLRVRDGMEDARYGSPGAPDVTGRQCGNGLVIEHGDGWESQYCHLRKGSIAVQPGAQVRSGDRLGEIGESGQAAFPHLHFELRHNGETIDPMDGRPMGAACDAEARSGQVLRQTLWRDPVPYQQTGIIALGFADRELDQDDLRLDSRGLDATSAWAPLLIFWVRTFGLQEGDIQAIEIRGPDGQLVAQSRTPPLEGAKVMSFLFAGRRRPGDAFPPGVYTGTYQVLRQTETVLTAEARTEIVALRGAEPVPAPER